MRTEEIIGVLAFLSLVFIPALALTARFAMKPIVESIVKLREAFNLPVGPNQDNFLQIERLEREVAELKRDVEQLQVEREFDKQLLRKTSPQQLPSGNE